MATPSPWSGLCRGLPGVPAPPPVFSPNQVTKVVCSGGAEAPAPRTGRGRPGEGGQCRQPETARRAPGTPRCPPPVVPLLSSPFPFLCWSLSSAPHTTGSAQAVAGKKVLGLWSSALHVHAYTTQQHACNTPHGTHVSMHMYYMIHMYTNTPHSCTRANTHTAHLHAHTTE